MFSFAPIMRVTDFTKSKNLSITMFLQRNVTLRNPLRMNLQLNLKIINIPSRPMPANTLTLIKI